ncbi:MAG TPA: alpha/beta fold hydrolase [Solirubrobacteraceae bacterium]|nr:alpha/beta fold hydrolase [Solirubrobacteraceae bacterium]
MSSPSRPPVAPAEAGLYGAWLDAWGAAAQGAADLFSASLGRWPRPFDFGRWFDVMAQRRPPRWATPHELVLDTPVARLRDFSLPGARRGLVPTLVLPPQAGHDSCIVDFSAEQSQMRAIREAGLARAFTLDWLGATPETADATIDDYLDAIDRAVDHCGGRVNLIGDCQGGWLATIYAAQAPERVNTLTIAGAPIDFTAGEPVIGSVLNTLTPGRDMAFYEWLVSSGGGVLRGRHMLDGFIMIGPSAEISRQLDLLVHVEDEAHVRRYAEFEDWFKHTQDIPGGFYLWIVRHLFMDNELIAGELEVRGGRIDLGRLEMPLNLLAGATDHITPPDQVYALADHASTAPEDVVRRLSSGGHLGLFMGHEALREQWPPLLAAVLERSLPRRRSAASGK